MKRVFVYVASPKWELNVYVSIHSLVQSGNEFDLIKIYSVGGKMSNIENIYPNVKVECVKNRDEEYFPNNKTYITKQIGEEVIYLDADTIVIGNVEKILESYKQNLVARVDSSRSVERGLNDISKKLKKAWKNEMGNEILKYKIYNSGFLVFKGNYNKKLKREWKRLSKIDKKIWKKVNIKKPKMRRITEQITLSISVEKEGSEVGIMDGSHHVYGWEKTPKEIGKDDIVYHTGSRGGRHLKYASAVARRCDLSFNTPLISSSTNPLFIRLQGYDLGYRAKHFYAGIGD